METPEPGDVGHGATSTTSWSGDLRGSVFAAADLRDARFVDSDLSGVVMRGVDVAGADLDAPWLVDGGGVLLVNGVDVAPLVDAELDRRFPGRELRRAVTPEGLRTAWGAVEGTWAATVARAEALPDGAVDVRVGGEWSFAETLRHLVQATDIWVGRVVLGREDPLHPVGISYADRGPDDPAPATNPAAPYDEVLEARASRLGLVRELLARSTPELLAEDRRNPWSPQRSESVLGCLHVVLREEWEHHRFAVRDLALLEAGSTAT
jgi:hypothetical protein